MKIRGCALPHLPRKADRVDNVATRLGEVFRGQIPSTWLSGQRSRTASCGDAEEGSAGTQERSAAMGSCARAEACQSSWDTRSLAMRAVRNRASGSGKLGRRSMSKMRL